MRANAPPHGSGFDAVGRLLLGGVLVASGCSGAAARPCTEDRAHPTSAACLGRTALPRDRASHEHLLRRLTFGARPGDLARLEALGAARWLEWQLAPERIPDTAAETAMVPYRDALRSPDELWAMHDDDPNAVPPELLAALGHDAMSASASPAPRASRNAQREQLEGALMMSAVARHLASDRQVLEVMTDLWTNHFNVFARKGNVRYLAGDLVERVLRPQALGSFPAMLVAVARHPAMLLYLDNARSVAARPSIAGRPPRGLNENFARELLELHTLGVDAGYTQRDVREVARALTGWGVSNPSESGALVFEFRAGQHDREEKFLPFLGLRLPAGGGEDEGLRVLRALAMHPRTAHTVARAVARRFVADEPPEELVQTLAESYLRTEGSVPAVLRTLVAHPLFWAPRYRYAKTRAPLDYVLASLRALDALPDGTDRLARLLQRLGQAPFMNPVPTGYRDDARRLGGSALIDRINFAIDLADGTLPGAAIELDRVLPLEPDGARCAARVRALVLASDAPAATVAALTETAGALPARAARRVALALALASPAFQRR